MPDTLAQRLAREVARASNRTDTPGYYVSWADSVLDAIEALGLVVVDPRDVTGSAARTPGSKVAS